MVVALNKFSHQSCFPKNMAQNAIYGEGKMTIQQEECQIKKNEKGGKHK
jgi:hypothetical protein